MYINYCYVIGEYFSGMKKVEFKKYIFIVFQFVTVNFIHVAVQVCYVQYVLFWVVFAQLILLSIIGPGSTT